MITTPIPLALFVHLAGAPTGGQGLLPGEWGSRFLQAGIKAAIGPGWAVDGVSWEGLRAAHRALGGGTWDAVLGVALRKPQAVILYVDTWTERDALLLTPLLQEALPLSLVLNAGPKAEPDLSDPAGVARALADHTGLPIGPEPTSAPTAIDLYSERGVPMQVAGKAPEDLRRELGALVEGGPAELAIEDLHLVDPGPGMDAIVDLLIEEFPTDGSIDLSVRIQAGALEEEAVRRLRRAAALGTTRLVAERDTDPNTVPEADASQIVIERAFPLQGDSPKALYDQLQRFLSRGATRVDLRPAGPAPYAAIATRDFPLSDVLEAAALGRIVAWGENPDRTPGELDAWTRHLREPTSVDDALALLRSGMAPDVALGSILLDIFGPRALDDQSLHAPALAVEAHLTEPPTPQEEAAIPTFAPTLTAWLEQQGAREIEVAAEDGGASFTGVNDDGPFTLRVLTGDSDEDHYALVGPWKVAYSGRFPGAELMDGLVTRLGSALQQDGTSGSA